MEGAQPKKDAFVYFASDFPHRAIVTNVIAFIPNDN